MKRKPEDWLKTKAFKDIRILDPDGWDRKNFEEDWNRLITKKEMTEKIMVSTIIRTVPSKPDMSQKD